MNANDFNSASTVLESFTQDIEWDQVCEETNVLLRGEFNIEAVDNMEERLEKTGLFTADEIKLIVGEVQRVVIITLT